MARAETAPVRSFFAGLASAETAAATLAAAATRRLERAAFASFASRRWPSRTQMGLPSACRLSRLQSCANAAPQVDQSSCTNVRSAYWGNSECTIAERSMSHFSLSASMSIGIPSRKNGSSTFISA